MLRTFAVWILLATTAALFEQSARKEPEAPPLRNNTDESAIRSLLAFGFRPVENNPSNLHWKILRCSGFQAVDEAVFINTTGGWVMGRENFLELITRLHAPGGPFHDHTRRHAIEELRLIRPDVAFAVVKTFDIKRAGAPTKGEETRGLIILSKEAGRWKVNALENTKIQPMPTGHP